MDSKRVITFLCVVSVVLAIFAGATYGVWRLMVIHVSADVARAWALIATALLPLTGWAAYRLGQVEARGMLGGLGLGITSALGAANKVADVKIKTARAMRQPDPAQMVVLPPPEIRPRRLPSGSNDEVIEL